MDADQDQEQFRELFSELKHADQRAAPSFERTWQAARSRQSDPRAASGILPWRASPRVRLAAAGLVAAAGIAAALLLGHHADSHRQLIVNNTPTTAPSGNPDRVSVAVADGVSIADWQSPTAFLLEPPDEFLPLIPAVEPGAAPRRNPDRHL
jgi:ferric-dicitrate binding protein FerR (iron transport regulator)